MNTNSAVLLSALMPHPPVVVPAVGHGREREACLTCDAMTDLAKRIVGASPQTLILISPHSPRRPAAFGIWTSAILEGTFDRFGAPKPVLRFSNSPDFIRQLRHVAQENGLHVWSITEGELDHGALVPLWYLHQAGWNGHTMVLGLNYPGEGQLEQMGACINKSAQALGQRVVVLASGDMSHRLKPGAPSGFHPEAHKFDSHFVELARAGDYGRIAQFDAHLQQIAGEDVVDSSRIAIAAAGGDNANHEVLSYEGPFGVGYCVAVFYSGMTENGHRSGHDVPRIVQIARHAVESFVRQGLAPTTGHEKDPGLSAQAGVFVTIRTRDGRLRGCIGSITPQHRTVAEETVSRAIAAATTDPRFSPVTPGELDGLRYEVSVLHPPQMVEHESELNPHKYGVIIVDPRGRRGVMLPNVEGLDTVERQLAATRQKAGIPPTAQVHIERFEVDKYSEDAL